MAASGNHEAAMEEFVLFNVAMSSRYAKFVSDIMERVLNGITPKQVDDISIQISSATTGFKKAVKSTYREFVYNVYFDKVFKSLGIRNPIVKLTIQNNTLKKFYDNIDGALSQTNRDVVKEIRKVQVDIIKHSKDLARVKDMSGLIEKERAALRLKLEKQFEKRHIDFFKMKDNRAFVRYSDGKLINFEAYNEMATRTTTMNVEREAVEINEKIEGRRVSEYFVRDTRSVKSERDVCRRIMSRRYLGKYALIAHDSAAADLFGIMTVDAARDEGAFGPNCRHSMRALSDAVYNRIDKTLFWAERQVV